MSQTLADKARPLLQQSEQGAPAIITESDIHGLPEVVQRYLRYAQVLGKAAIRTVHLKQRGSFRTKQGQAWLPLVAEQYYAMQPPAFLWHGVIKQAPLLSISAWDRFAAGHGSLVVKLLSLITLVDAHGPETDQGEALRYLSEIIWFPTAWLSDYLQWEAIDDHSARVTMQQPSVTASAVLCFNDQDQLVRMTAERHMLVDGKPVLEPWETRAGDYREVQGLRIPFQAEALWKLPAGEFSYFRGEITEIDYTRIGLP